MSIFRLSCLLGGGHLRKGPYHTTSWGCRCCAANEINKYNLCAYPVVSERFVREKNNAEKHRQSLMVAFMESSSADARTNIKKLLSIKKFLQSTKDKAVRWTPPAQSSFWFVVLNSAQKRALAPASDPYMGPRFAIFPANVRNYVTGREGRLASRGFGSGGSSHQNCRCCVI